MAEKPSQEEAHIMEGLVSRIIDEASKGRSDRTVLDVATQIKADALNELDPDDPKDAKFLEACDTVIDSAKGQPDKTISDFYKEHPQKRR